jgi:hypothetical protein
MDYDELVAKVIELLQREKRVPYRVLKRRFDVDDEYIEDLKIDLIEAKRLAGDENDRILVWVGEQASPLATLLSPTRTRCSSNDCARTGTPVLYPQTPRRKNLDLSQRSGGGNGNRSPCCRDVRQ